MELKTTNFERTFYSGKKIILSGSGGVTESLLLNADKIDNLLCICDRKAPADGSGEWMGYPYTTIENAVNRYEDFYVAISSFKYYEEIKKDWMEYLPEDRILPYLNWETRFHFNMEKTRYQEWLRVNTEKIEKVYYHLGDEPSRKSFRYFLQGTENISADAWMQVAYSSNILADYFPRTYFSFNNETVYVDIGGCDGDSVLDFIRASENNFGKIIACEPDEKMFYVMQKTISDLGDERIICHNTAVGAHNGIVGFSVAQNPFLNTVDDESPVKVKIESIDSLKEPVRMLKVSINGEQNNLNVLEGGRQTILKYKPQMSFITPPNENILLDVPAKILEIDSSYKIYFRLTSYPQAEGQRFSGCIYASIN